MLFLFILSSLSLSSTWDLYLEPLQKFASSGAIISLQGAKCAHFGPIITTKDEDIEIAKIMSGETADKTVLGSMITIAGKKYMVNRQKEMGENSFLVAQAGKDRAVAFRSNSVIVAAFFCEGQDLKKIIEQLNVILWQMKQNNI